jgi:hypothetical protein
MVPKQFLGSSGGYQRVYEYEEFLKIPREFPKRFLD